MKPNQIAETIKEMRETNITLSSMADKIGIKRQYLRYYLSKGIEMMQVRKRTDQKTYESIMRDLNSGEYSAKSISIKNNVALGTVRYYEANNGRRKRAKGNSEEIKFITETLFKGPDPKNALKGYIKTIDLRDDWDDETKETIRSFATKQIELL